MISFIVQHTMRKAWVGRCVLGSRSASRAPREVAPGEQMPGAINMGLADGHTELVKLDDLWKYYWHLDWQPPVTRSY